MKLDKKPRITVVTVCYNAAENLQKTVLSVKGQTYKNIEYIIIDGASKDGSVDIIKQYSEVVCRWISEPDNGIYDAMNKGIDIATGEWIIFMNAGDVFYSEDAIEKVFSARYGEDVGLIYGDVMLDFGELGLIKKRFSRITEERVPYEICHQSVFTRTSVLKELHYDISYKICADCASFASIYRKGLKLIYAPYVVSIFEIVEGVSSKRIILSYKEHCRIEGKKTFALSNLRNTAKAYLKSLLLSLLPTAYYNKMRYNSVKSRIIYN